jgi:hypothetical protein
VPPKGPYEVAFNNVRIWGLNPTSAGPR